MFWQTSRRKLTFERPLVMGILNVTPDSFSGGGGFFSVDEALAHAEKMVTEGADILDIGGESTRPNSSRVSENDEMYRVFPVIEKLAERFDTPISVDTTRSSVALAAVQAGAEIINDISGLRFDESIADVAAGCGAGLLLMHSRGTFETMHVQNPSDDILREVSDYFTRAIGQAMGQGVSKKNIALDVGFGFSKTFEQNLELLAKLDRLIAEFQQFPMLVGTSRKSFIGKILGDVPPEARLSGSLATVAVAVLKGAAMVRVHDVKATVDAIRVAVAIKSHL